MQLTDSVVVSILSVTVSVISFIASILILSLIRAFKKWNGYLLLLTSMSLCQIIYDVSFYLYFGNNFSRELYVVFHALQGLGGLSVAIWTNVLSFVVFYVVHFRTFFDISRYYWILLAVAMIPSFFIFVISIVADANVRIVVDVVYYWLRIVSIVLNIGFYVAIREGTKNMKSLGEKESAITLLAERMIYYPLIQTISRIGAAVYEGIYGFEPFPTAATSTGQFISGIFMSILTPSAGLGYLIIFLIFQPNAASLLLRWIRCNFFQEQQNENFEPSVSFGPNPTSSTAIRSLTDCDDNDLIEIIRSGNSAQGSSRDSSISSSRASQLWAGRMSEDDMQIELRVNGSF